MLTRRQAIVSAAAAAVASAMPRAWARHPRGGASGSGSVLNPIGTNFAAGGGSQLSYENLAIFKNRVREGRGFTVYSSSTPSTVQVSLNSSGWPTTDFCCFLWEGSIIPAWASAATSGMPFKCGFIGSGSETITAQDGCTVANIVHGFSGAYTTFDLYNVTGSFGFNVQSTTGGATNIFAYLPAYPAASIDNPMSASAYRPEAITFYSQFSYLRAMWWSYVTNNVIENTSTTRRTYLNTQSQQGWFNAYPNATEGYPADWMATFCAACDIGIWYCLPVWEDGTDNAAGSYSTSLLTMLNTVVVPTGKKIFLEIGNELWNAGTYPNGTVLATLAVSNGFPNSTTGTYEYLGYKLHALATMCRSIFGAAFGSQVQIVLASQTGSSGWDTYFPTVLSYMQSNYGAPSADISYLGIAPYENLANNAGDTSVALVLSDLNTVGAGQAYANNSETDSILAQHYGLKLISYEGGWQTNSEASGNSYIASAIMNSGLTAAMQTYWSTCLNAGYAYLTNFESGSSSGGTPYTPEDELSNNDATLLASGSPRLAAMQTYFPGTYASTRNVISGHAQSILGGNFADLVGGTPPTLQDFTTVVSPYSAGIQLTCTDPGVYSLVLTVVGSGTTNVEVNSSVVYTGVTLSAGANTIGNITLKAGINYILFGNGAFQGVTSITSITLN